jgi:high-affinity nickel-transport protein
MTFVSVVVALLVGGIEALGLIARRAALHGPFWDAVHALNRNFGIVGYVIIGVFALCWGISTLVYRLKGYDELGVARF